MKSTYLKITIIIGLLLAGCGKSEPASGQEAPGGEVLVTQPVGAQGGTVQTGDGSVVLEIPVGALSSGKDITISSVTDYPNKSGAVAGGTVYEFGPDGLQFDKPVKLILQFETGNIPSDKTDGLRLYKRVNDRWMPVAGASEVNGNTLSGHINSFSSYGIVDIRLLSLFFDRVSLNSFYKPYDKETYLGNLWTLADGQQDIYFPEGGIPETTIESNPNCGSSTQQFRGGMDITDEEYMWNPEARVGSQQSNAIIDVSSSSLGDAELYIFSRTVAVPEAGWSEEGEEGGEVSSDIALKLVADIKNPDRQSYIIAATWRDLKTQFKGSGEYEIGVDFRGATCEESYELGGSSYELFWYNWEEDGEVDISVGTGRLFEIDGEQHGQFILDVLIHTISWSNKMYTPHDGGAIVQATFYLDLLPIVN